MQSCKYLQDNAIQIPSLLTSESLKTLLMKRIKMLDFAQAKNDARSFIRDARELDLWSWEFFEAIAKRVEIVGEQPLAKSTS